MLACSVYLRVLHGPFVFDDLTLPENLLVQVSRPADVLRLLLAPGVPRKLGLLSFALNYALGGLDPFGYHLGNVLLHAVNGVLVFLLAFRLLSLTAPALARPATVTASVLSAGAWLLHPVQTQAVAYVYQRFTVLCAFFYLLAVLLYLEARIRTPGPRRAALLVAASLAALAALLSKENAATLPAVAACLELTVLRPGTDTERAARTRLLVGALVATLGLTALLLGTHAWPMMAADYARRGFTMGQRLLTEPRVIVHYLSLLAWPDPRRLNLDYDVRVSTSLLSPATTLPAILVLGGGLAFAWWRRRREPLLALAILWFLAGLSVESSFVPLDLAYEHRLYLPSVVLLVWAVREVHLRWPRAAVALLASILVLLGLGTWQRNALWRDPAALWADTVRKSPGKPRARLNLAKALLERGRLDEAEGELLAAAALGPGRLEPEVRTSLGVLALQRGQYDRARELLASVVQKYPAYAPARVNLGVVHYRAGRLEEAAQEFEWALAIEGPRRPQAHYNVASAYFALKAYRQSAAVAREGLALWPRSADLHAIAGAALIEAGDPEAGRAELEAARVLAPDHPLVRRYAQPDALGRRRPSRPLGSGDLVRLLGG